MNEEHIDYLKFCFLSEDGKPKGINHFKVFRAIKDSYHILIIGGTPFIYTNGVYLQDRSGARLKSIIRGYIFPDFIKSPLINNIYNLFLQDIELETNIDDCNLQPKHWVCFLNGFWDCINERLEQHDPKYKCLNQIPHCFECYKDISGAVTDKYLFETYPKADDREMLLQYFFYSMTAETKFQKFMVISSIGGTGKSTMLNLFNAVIGDENLSSISLDELSQKFASYGLVGKLCNVCADLDIDALSNASLLKQAIGEDRIRTEQKGHDALFCRSYAKMIFSTNELPLIKNEKSNAVYRRLLVLKIEKPPQVVDVDLSKKLINEVDYFIQILMQAGHRMYQKGCITVSEGSKQAVAQLWRDSDTTQAFLDECCTVTGDKSDRVERGELFRDYESYCEQFERQKLTKNNFYKSLRVKGLFEGKSGDKRYFLGLKNAHSMCETRPDGFEKFLENECPFK
jgi:P4 family phage/plasmid primase-like protien